MDKQKRIQKVCEFFCDGIVLALSTVITYALFGVYLNKILDYLPIDWKQYIIILALSYTIIFFTFSTSIDLKKRSRSKEALSVFRNTLATFMLFAALLLILKNPMIDSRYLFLGSFFVDLFLSGIARYFLKRLMMALFSSDKIATLVGVITVSNLANDFVSALSSDWSKNIVGVAVVDSVRINDKYYVDHHFKNKGSDSVAIRNKLKEIKEIYGVPVVANLENIIDWIKISSIDEVFINIPYLSSESITKYVEEIEAMGITVHINLTVLEKMVENSEFDNIECGVTVGYPMATFSAAQHNFYELWFKRSFDVFGSLVGIIVSIPIILLVSIPLLIESPGGLFFKQPRIGRNGRMFNMYKLRSMYKDAEERKCTLESSNDMDGFMFKMDNDPRITKVGRFIRKTSIDELPQFFNVLKGDMSLVGTRPPTVDEFEKYESHHKRRLSLRPGMTGMWQVSGRSEITDFEDVVSLDCEYIDTWSIPLDFKILLKTIPAVLGSNGAK